VLSPRSVDDAFEVSVVVSTLTADRTVTLPDLTGFAALTSGTAPLSSPGDCQLVPRPDGPPRSPSTCWLEPLLCAQQLNYHTVSCPSRQTPRCPVCMCTGVLPNDRIPYVLNSVLVAPATTQLTNFDLVGTSSASLGSTAGVATLSRSVRG
jgi:hypothetical protein